MQYFISESKQRSDFLSFEDQTTHNSKLITMLLANFMNFAFANLILCLVYTLHTEVSYSDSY